MSDNLPSIVHLDPKRQRFVHLYLTGAYTNKEISQMLDITENTLYSWLRDDAVQGVIKDIQKVEHEAIDVALKASRTKAVNKMMELMESPVDAIAFQACKDILDRTGHKAKSEIKVDKTVKTIEMQLNDLADAIITDVDFEEVD